MDREPPTLTSPIATPTATTMPTTTIPPAAFVPPNPMPTQEGQVPGSSNDGGLQPPSTVQPPRRGRAQSPQPSEHGSTREDFLDAIRYRESQQTARMQTMMDAQSQQLAQILKANADQKHHGGDAKTWSMNNSRMIDTRDSIKMATWDGTRSKFDAYKLNVYMCIGAMSDEHLHKLQQVEQSLDTLFMFASLTQTDQAQAREILPHLTNSTTDKAASSCLGCESNNGFEVWRSLCKLGLIRDSEHV